jgi:hypothetical protein
MATELEGFEIPRTEAADLTFGAFSTGTHVDLVGACALACWQRMDRRQYTTVDLIMERLGYRRGRAPVHALVHTGCLHRCDNLDVPPLGHRATPLGGVTGPVQCCTCWVCLVGHQRQQADQEPIASNRYHREEGRARPAARLPTATANRRRGGRRPHFVFVSPTVSL